MTEPQQIESLLDDSPREHNDPELLALETAHANLEALRKQQRDADDPKWKHTLGLVCQMNRKIQQRRRELNLLWLDFDQEKEDIRGFETEENARCAPALGVIVERCYLEGRYDG